MDYEVSYGKPPRHTRFKKGEPSANSRGRQTVMRSSSNSWNYCHDLFVCIHRQPPCAGSLSD